MKKMRFGGALFVAAAAVMALASIQDYSLRPTPKVGEVFKYKMSGELMVMGMNVGMSAVMINKTLKVDSNGDYVVEGSMTELKAVMNGSEVELEQPPSSTTTFKADGTPIEVKGEAVEAGGLRMANLMTMVVGDKPFKVGDSWTTEIKEDKAKGTPAVTSTYKFEAVEKLDDGEAAKVSFESKETGGDAPATISGTAWIDVKTKNPVKTDTTWKNVPVPGAPEPVSGKMTMTLIK